MLISEIYFQDIIANIPILYAGGAQCGLRPLEHSSRRRRQAAGDLDPTAPREVEMPRYQKIVGGDMAQHGMYPWQVWQSLAYNITRNVPLAGTAVVGI